MNLQKIAVDSPKRRKAIKFLSSCRRFPCVGIGLSALVFCRQSEAFNPGDIDAFVAFCADDAVIDIALFGTHTDQEEIRVMALGGLGILGSFGLELLWRRSLQQG